jgi:hypothetical protein
MIKHLHTILTQDNHCTAEPCFLVFGHKKIFIDPDFAEHGEAVYVESETGDYLEMSEEEYERLEEEYLTPDEYKIPTHDPVLDTEFNPDNWERRAYFWGKEFNQVFFTEAAAKEYIEVNSHRIPGSRDGQKPIVYVESFYRNPEMIAVRKMLIDKAEREREYPSL